MQEVRITVIKRRFDKELVERYLTEELRGRFAACDQEVGQSYLIGDTVRCPEGLCPWAWRDIEPFVRIVAFEGKLEGGVPPDSWVRCCTDALRPVTFLIEPAPAAAE